MVRRIVAGIGGICLLLAGGWWYIHSRKTPADENLTLYGNVDIRDVSLSFRVSGRLREMRKEEGDRVKAGDVLAVLDKDTFEDDLKLTMAELSETQAALKNAEETYNRRVKLEQTGSGAKALSDDAGAARDQAQARVETARAHISKAKTALSDTQLLAPSEGVMLTRVREPGAIVQAGQPVYSLALDNPVWVRTYVEEPHLGRISPGQKAIIITDSGGHYEGRIGFISPQAEFTPKNVETTQLRTDLVFRLRVIVDQPDKGLRQGMPVTVRIEPTVSGSNLKDGQGHDRHDGG